MLHRLAQEESDAEVLSSQTSIASSEFDKLEIDDRVPSMSTVFTSMSSPRSRSSSPSGSNGPDSRKSSSIFHRRKFSSSSSDTEKKKREDGLVRWLRDGTVIYKSVGLGLMDLVVGIHLVQVANMKNIGTSVDGF